MSNVGAFFRILRAGWILTREGVIIALPYEKSPGFGGFIWRLLSIFTRRAVKRTKRKERLANAIARLGPSYVKLGQFLATRPDIIGKELAQELAILQDRMETFSKTIAIHTIEHSLGKNISELFKDFSEPIAAASIAQVHHAWVENNGTLTEVAVKVIRPGVRKSFARDLESYFFAARLQERYIPWLRRLRPVDVVATLENVTRIEMDLRLEAAALSEFAENTINDTGFRVPCVDWERTSRDILTMEWIEGIKLNDFKGLEEAGHDRIALAVCLMQSFLRQTLRDGFFHADMHPGNLLVEKDGTLVALDFGITGRLEKKERRFFAEILYGFITRDFLKVAKVHIEAGYVPDTYDVASFAQAIRAIGEPIHGQSAEKISMAKILTLLFEMTETFDMETQPQLLMLQKTMVVVEGVARTLDPAFDMWTTAKPVVEEWMHSNLGPTRIVNEISEGYETLKSIMCQMPHFMKQAQKLSHQVSLIIDDRLLMKGRLQKIYNQKEKKQRVWERSVFWLMVFFILYIISSRSW